MDKKETAKKLVIWSHILAWGGIALAIIGALAAGSLFRSATGATVAAGCGGVSLVVGAILGQVGRGMQGRVI